MSDEEQFSGWAVLELMGHRRLAGYVTETTLAGAGVLRIDLVASEGEEATQYYGGGAVYCLTPCTEETARAVAARSLVKPPSLLGLPAPQYLPVSMREDKATEYNPPCDTCAHPLSEHAPADEISYVGGEIAGSGACLVEGCECIEYERDIPF